jgi:decaprenylphospho-beta-D-ribofuranose 2-oxidase
MAPAPTRRVLTGWGRTAPSGADVRVPADAAEVTSLLAGEGAQGGVIARGLGRSYGDAAQCAGGTVLDTGALDEIGPIDPASGIVEVGAGVSLHALMRAGLPRGWFVPVSPGTRQVTVGGAVAADVHGKNHHRDGSFCRHVTRATLVTPSGVFEIGPGREEDLFRATAGGMGLTGVVARATVRMTPVETSWMVVDTERFADLDTVMAAMEASDAEYRYSVAWVDCMAGGRRLGRSILTRGHHAVRADLGRRQARRAQDPPGEPRLRVPFPAPAALLNPLTVSAFNEMWFRRAPRRRWGELQPLATFFHPLDGIADWNLLYGRPGFVQYQFVVAPERAEVVRRAVALLSGSRVPSFFAVLKRFGPGDGGYLSFPMEGWTLALDFPLGSAALPTVLDQVDEMVAAAGGRVYLAKDARLRPELLGAMYPDLGRLADARRRVDPEGLLRSDLSRRLGMEGGSRW